MNHSFVIFQPDDGNGTNGSNGGTDLAGFLDMVLSGLTNSDNSNSANTGHEEASNTSNNANENEHDTATTNTEGAHQDQSTAPQTETSNNNSNNNNNNNNDNINRSAAHRFSLPFFNISYTFSNGTINAITTPRANGRSTTSNTGNSTDSNATAPNDLSSTASAHTGTGPLGLSVNANGTDNRAANSNNNTQRPVNNFNTILEIATNIAVQAFGHNFRRNGIKRATFDEFPTKSKGSLTDTKCPICFEEYDDLVSEEEESEEQNQNKRKREEHHDDEKNGDDSQSKKSKVKETDIPVETTEQRRESQTQTPEELLRAFQETQRPDYIDTSATSASSRNETPRPATIHPHQTDAQEAQAEPYSHVPVELPCHHVFGRSCLYEWLKSKNSCPLCRETVHQDHSSNGTTNGSFNNGESYLIILNTPQNFNNNNEENNPTSANDTQEGERATGNNDSSNSTVTTTNTNQNLSQSLSSAPAASSQTAARTLPTPVTPSSGRSPFSASLLRNLGSFRNTDSLFTTGVESRRTRNGVETVHINGGTGSSMDSEGNIGASNSSGRNNTGGGIPQSTSFNSASSTTNGNITNNFFQESSRLLHERIQSNGFLNNVLGFNNNTNDAAPTFQDFVTERFQEQLRRGGLRGATNSSSRNDSNENTPSSSDNETHSNNNNNMNDSPNDDTTRSKD